MNDDEMRELIIDYIDGNLPGELEEFLEKQIQKDEKTREEYEHMKKVMDTMRSSPELDPEGSLRENFISILEEEKISVEEAEGRTIHFREWWSINNLLKVAAAVAILVIGFFIGFYNRPGDDREIEALRKEMEATKQLVMMSLQQKSASKRIMGVTASQEMENADKEIIDALIRTLNKDENVNVRLAAVSALSNFTEIPRVKRALIDALEEQKEPIVQIELINLMVEMQEKKAIENLRKLVNDEETIQTVKDEAHMGLFKLM